MKSYNEDNNNTENERSVMEALHRLMRTLRRGPHSDRSHSGHSRGYNRLLRILIHNEGASARELADLLEIRPASLAELLAKMEQDGFILRRKDEKVGRVQRISLSEMGKARLRSMKEKKTDEPLINEILTAEEKDTLIDLCNKLTEGLAERSVSINEPSPGKGAL